MKTVKGQFSIKATPLELGEFEKHLGFSRMMYEKHFVGGLEALSMVIMMGTMKKDLGSGGYVAIERVEGTLAGRRGSFCLQHSSLMRRGKPEQFISVIPDTGTDELSGLSGRMTIEIKDGNHFFTFEYSVDKG